MQLHINKSMITYMSRVVSCIQYTPTKHIEHKNEGACMHCMLCCLCCFVGVIFKFTLPRRKITIILQLKSAMDYAEAPTLPRESGYILCMDNEYNDINCVGIL